MKAKEGIVLDRDGTPLTVDPIEAKQRRLAVWKGRLMLGAFLGVLVPILLLLD